MTRIFPCHLLPRQRIVWGTSMSLFNTLTEREFAIVSRLVIGQTQRAICEELHIGEATLNNFCNSIYFKLKIGGNVQGKRKRLAELFYARHQPEGPGAAPPAAPEEPAPIGPAQMDPATLQEAFWQTWMALLAMEHRALAAEDICRRNGWRGEQLDTPKPFHGHARIASVPINLRDETAAQ